MSLFTIDFTQLVSDLLPSPKRTTENKAFVRGLLSGGLRSHDIFLASKLGADVHLGSTFWSAGTYVQYESVIYLPTGAVYECVVTSTSTTPGTSTDWEKILDSFIGFDESQYFDGQAINLVWALNRRYNTTFLQDPDAVSLSDIYLETITDGLDMFQVGGNESNSSSVYSNTASEFITAEDTTQYNKSFRIKIPAAVFASLGATVAEQDASVRQFVDQYITEGVFYEIEDY